MGKCTKCGRDAGIMMSMCSSCVGAQIESARARGGHDDTMRQVEALEAANKLRRVQLTTASELAGHDITRTIEIITAECVFGMNLFRDFFGGMSDIFGGRSQTTQRALREARETVLLELRREAVRVGANAVIAVDLDYSEFSGQGKSMLFLVASGTAVEVWPSTNPSR